MEDIESKGILGFFEFVVSGNGVAKHKPDPEGLLKVLGLLKAEKKESVFVGDTWTDLKAATSAGVPSILYHPRSHSKFNDLKELTDQKPTHVVKSYAELTRLLTKSKNLE